MIKPTKTKRLVVARETVRRLGAAELGRVQGGLEPSYFCTLRTRFLCDPPPPNERREFLIDLLAAEFRRQSRALG